MVKQKVDPIKIPVSSSDFINSPWPICIWDVVGTLIQDVVETQRPHHVLPRPAKAPRVSVRIVVRMADKHNMRMVVKMAADSSIHELKGKIADMGGTPMSSLSYGGKEFVDYFNLAQLTNQRND